MISGLIRKEFQRNSEQKAMELYSIHCKVYITIHKMVQCNIRRNYVLNMLRNHRPYIIVSHAREIAEILCLQIILQMNKLRMKLCFCLCEQYYDSSFADCIYYFGPVYLNIYINCSYCWTYELQCGTNIETYVY